MWENLFVQIYTASQKCLAPGGPQATLLCGPKQYHVESSCSVYPFPNGSEVVLWEKNVLGKSGEVHSAYCQDGVAGRQVDPRITTCLVPSVAVCWEVATLPNGPAPGSLPLRSQYKAQTPARNHGTQALSLIWFSFLMAPVVTRDCIPIVSVYFEICKVLLLAHSSLNLWPTHPRHSTKAISSRASQCELSVRIYFQFLGQDPWEN